MKRYSPPLFLVLIALCIAPLNGMKRRKPGEEEPPVSHIPRLRRPHEVFLYSPYSKYSLPSNTEKPNALYVKDSYPIGKKVYLEAGDLCFPEDAGEYTVESVEVDRLIPNERGSDILLTFKNTLNNTRILIGQNLDFNGNKASPLKSFEFQQAMDPRSFRLPVEKLPTHIETLFHLFKFAPSLMGKRVVSGGVQYKITDDTPCGVIPHDSHARPPMVKRNIGLESETHTQKAGTHPLALWATYEKSLRQSRVTQDKTCISEHATVEKNTEDALQQPIVETYIWPTASGVTFFLVATAAVVALKLYSWLKPS